MCLFCPDCGCNINTNLCEVGLCLRSDVERSTTQAAVEVQSLSKTKAAAPSSGKY